MSSDLLNFKDRDLARSLIESIRNIAPERYTIMEVCGTHTVSIARSGLRNLMPTGIQLVSGPGCPVCVTAHQDIDNIIELARTPHVILTTFGDMTRVPGTSSSLHKEKAAGCDIRVVYSPLDALRIAQENPSSEIVFAGVGFETTTPLVAMAIQRAAAASLTNFSVYSAHKNMPGALEVLVRDPKLKIDALLLPGHVSTIIGTTPYEFLAQDYHIPGVITGFEPLDILCAIRSLLQQARTDTARIENAYTRAVMHNGNPVAQKAIQEVFETCDAQWRGLGTIAGSGYKIAPAYASFDARLRFAPCAIDSHEPSGCMCADVLRGYVTPRQCPLFDHVCTPEHPVGPCMVSSEGACAAWWNYYRVQV